MLIKKWTMATATVRIPVLVTAQENAAASFRPSEDEQLLEGMIVQMLKTTAQASAAIDDALAFVEASNKRISAMESGRAR